MRRRLILGALGAVAILLGGYSTWWFVLSREVEADFSAWVGMRRAEGWTVEARSQHLAFWPLAAGIELSGLVVRGGPPSLPAAFDWTSTRLGLSVAPFHPGRLSIVSLGEQRVAAAGGPAIVLDDGDLRARVSLDRPAPPWVVDVDAGSVRAALETGKPALIERATAHVTFDPPAATTRSALALTVSARHIELPSGRPWPLGPLIEAIDADVTLTGPMAPLRSTVLVAQAWQQAGGAAVLRASALRYGPLNVVGNATGGLDADLQPEAKGLARVTGWAAALDRLTANGFLDQHAAMTAKAFISLLATAPKDGGASTLTLPLELGGGVLSVHRIPLLRVRALTWPDT